MQIIRKSLYLHSTLSVVLAVFGGVLLFVALHCKVFVLSALFPVIVMEVVSVPAMYVMFVDPRYQVMVGGGNALLLTTQRTFLWLSFLIVHGLSFGFKETLRTSTVNKFILKTNVFLLLFANTKQKWPLVRFFKVIHWLRIEKLFFINMNFYFQTL